MAFIGVPLLPGRRFGLNACRNLNNLGFGSNVSQTLSQRRPESQSMRNFLGRFYARPRMMSDLPRDAKDMTESEWKDVLSARAYHVLRQKGTEPAGSGEYDKFYPKEGHFVCAGCNAPLYSAEAKFNSGCGWPAFDKCYKGAVDTVVDSSFGMRRVEILCGNCQGHLGHVFEGERMTKTNERHCVNSLSVKYVKAKVEQEEAKVV